MSTISAGTTTTTALVQTGDTTGSLVLQTGSTPTTAMTINSSQVVDFANTPTIAGAAFPSGAMSLISTQTITGGTSLAFTGLTTYNKYQIIVEDLYGTGGSILFLQLGYGSTTYITSNYQWINFTAYRGSAGSNGSGSYSSVTDSGVEIAGAAQSIGLSTFNGMSGNILLTNMLASYGNNRVSGTALIGGDGYGNGSSAAMEIDSVGFSNPDTNPKTAIKLYTPYGTITGRFSLYGISS